MRCLVFSFSKIRIPRLDIYLTNKDVSRYDNTLYKQVVSLTAFFFKWMMQYIFLLLLPIHHVSSFLLSLEFWCLFGYIPSFSSPNIMQFIHYWQLFLLLSILCPYSYSLLLNQFLTHTKTHGIF